MTTQDLWSQYGHRLTGLWRATSYHLYAPSSDSEPSNPSDPIVAKPHGDNPLGRVQISTSGYLSAHLAIPSKLTAPLPSGLPWQIAPDNEVAFVARGLSIYCGYMTLHQNEAEKGDDGEGGLWWETRVEVCSDPSRYGGLEKRWIRFVRGEDGGERVELRPFQDLVGEDGQRLRGVITWERME